MTSSLLLGAAIGGGVSLGASNLGGSTFGSGGGAGALNAGGAIAGAAGAAAVGAGACGVEGGASIAACTALPEIIRVNSPGPELELALIEAAEAGAGGMNGSGGASLGTCDRRWINLVTLPASTLDGSAGGAGVYEGSGSGR